MMRMTDMVKHLLIINIIFFVGSYLAPQAQEYFALYYFENPKFKLWQPLTHMFMHANIMHIFFNMFGLIMFGSTLEQFWGGKKFLFFYISCGLGAMLLHTGINYFEIHSLLQDLNSLNIPKDKIYEMMSYDISDGDYFRSEILFNKFKDVFETYNFTQDQFNSLFQAACKNQTPAVGASGAIYGLLVAFAFMFPNAELMLIFLPIPIKAKYFVPGLLLMDLYLGVNGNPIFGGSTGVAHFAHIGGALIGFFMMWFWKKNQFDKNRWDR